MKTINRRTFLAGAAAAPLAAQTWIAEGSAMQTGTLMYAGTQTKETSKGIYAYEWSADKGTPKSLGLAAETPTPSFLALAPGGKRLYAVNEIEDYKGRNAGSVSGFSIDAATGKLTLLNVAASGGTGPCHLSLDQTGRALFAANYTGGSAASFHLDTIGNLSDAVSTFPYTGHGPNAERQEAAHVHRATVSPDNRFVMFNDLGLDCIHVYKLDAKTAKLTANDPPQWTGKPGAGPRALRFHPNGKVAYCASEMACTIDVLSWDAQHGALKSIQNVSMLPEGFHGVATASEIVMDRSARFLYAAVRSYDRIVVFSIGESDGKLKFVDSVSCGGNIPRHMALDPTEHCLLVANQESDTIAILERDALTGKIVGKPRTYPISKPQCLVFV